MGKNTRWKYIIYQGSVNNVGYYRLLLTLGRIDMSPL